MKTFFLTLRLVFWANPLQRVLTCLGVMFIVFDAIRTTWRYFEHADSLARFGGAQKKFFAPSDFFWNIVFFDNSHWVVISIAAACLLMGGVYWRFASAPRIVRLAPHGRPRLLVSVLSVVLLVAVLSMAKRWLWLFGLCAIGWRYSGGLADYGILIGMTASAVLCSMAVAGLFIASRSPLAALLVLLVLLSPVLTNVVSPVTTDIAFDVPNNRLEFPERMVLLLALVWIPLSIWYLRARRINPPGWLAGGSQDVLATTLVSSTAPTSRGEALQRQLLGGTTIIRFGMQWFLILGFLLGLQWLLASAGDTYPALSARVMYASLCICPVVTTMVSFAAIRRSRALWLLTDSTRSEFFSRIERILIRLNLVMALVVAIWLAVLWCLEWWRPGAAEDQLAMAPFLVLSLWLLGTFAIYTQLAGWPKWPVATIAAGTLLLIFMWWVSILPTTSPSEKAVTGLAVTGLLIAAMTTMIALRWHAQRSWREGDFPRAITSTASGT